MSINRIFQQLKQYIKRLWIREIHEVIVKTIENPIPKQKVPILDNHVPIEIKFGQRLRKVE